MLWGKGHNILSDKKNRLQYMYRNDPNFVRKISI